MLGRIKHDFTLSCAASIILLPVLCPTHMEILIHFLQIPSRKKKCALIIIDGAL